MISIGNKKRERGVSDSPLFILRRMLSMAVLMISVISVSAQSPISTKVYHHNPSGKYYGKMYIPKGAKYYIDLHPQTDVTIGVYDGYIDGINIYLTSVRLLEDRYMIDATKNECIFIVRSTSSEDVVAQPVGEELDNWMSTNGYRYYNATNAMMSDFMWATEKISNSTLMNKYAKKNIYVMANPAKNDLAFAYLNHQETGRDVQAGSLYIVTRKNYVNSRLNIIWNDEPDVVETEATKIDGVNHSTESRNDGAIYTLQGVRVSVPVKGHLYIRNGQKYIAQ